MLRTLGLPIISVLLVSSLLAPPVMSLFDENCSIAMMISPEEEEKGNEKEAEKKQHEKNLFVDNLVCAHGLSFKKKQSNPIDCELYLTEYQPDIVVPPPRALV